MGDDGRLKDVAVIAASTLRKTIMDLAVGLAILHTNQKARSLLTYKN
jgi:hypothetical protein